MKAKKAKKKTTQHLKKSKSPNFLERLREDNPMVEYLTNLRIMNPAADIKNSLNQPRREGGFVRLAHAREEFTAPIITKGKSVVAKKKRKRSS